MAYFVWLQYFAVAPVSKAVKSMEYKYSDKHVHGLQPTQTQINDLLPSLYANVSSAYETYNENHPTAIVPYPGNIAVAQAYEVKTRSGG